MDKEQLKTHLEQRQSQLNVLINLLESQGEKHPEYRQLSTLENEKQIVDSQLKRLLKLM